MQNNPYFVERCVLVNVLCAEWESLKEAHYDGDISHLTWQQDSGAFNCLCFCTIQVF